MKQLFCDIQMRTGEKSVDISVRVSDAIDCGTRRHFCPERGRLVAIDIAGASRDTALYCPLCGAPTSEALADVRPGAIDRHPEYDGPRCPHDYPDATCAEVIAALPGYEYLYERGIAEFRALCLAAEFGSAGSLADWARPCALCRDRFLGARYAVLESELLSLSDHLSRAGRAANARVESIRKGMALVHGLLDDISKRRDAIRADRPDEDLGYIYAITDGTAIKIGWTARHPRSRLAQLQTASPAELQLIGAVLASAYQERTVHHRFASHRIRGEWFRHVPEIVEYFSNG
jgi:T5orf172 domain